MPTPSARPELTEEETLAAEAAARQAFQAQPGDGTESLDAFLQKETARIAAEKLRADTVKDVAVTDADLQAALDDLALDQRTVFEEDPDLFGISVMEGETVYYAPAGYRYAKVLLLRTDDQQLAALREQLRAAQEELDRMNEQLEKATLARDQAAIRALNEEQAQAEQALERAKGSLDASQAIANRSIQRRLGEVTQKAKAPGADFDALIAEYGQDRHMPATGYAVRAGFSGLDAALVSAAMALRNPGDVSQPVAVEGGYALVQYAGNVPAGALPLDQARDGLAPGILEQKRQETYEAAVRAWMEEADIVENLALME